jgi:hypothetical protein
MEEPKDVAIKVAKIFLERSQNRATFRIRAVSMRDATVILQIDAARLGDFRKMVDDFHEWQKRGWAQEGPESPSKAPKADTEELLQPAVRELLKRDQG